MFQEPIDHTKHGIPQLVAEDLDDPSSTQTSHHQDLAACMEQYPDLFALEESMTSQVNPRVDDDIALGQIGLPSLYPVDMGPVDMDSDLSVWNDLFNNTYAIDSFANDYDTRQYQNNNQSDPELFADFLQQWETPNNVEPQDQTSTCHQRIGDMQVTPQYAFDPSLLNYPSEDVVPLDSADTFFAQTGCDSIPVQPTQTTPGFAAIPYDPHLWSYPPIPYHEPFVRPDSIYPDPSDLMYPTQPYFVTQPDLFHGYVPINQPKQSFELDPFLEDYTQNYTSQQQLQYEHVDVEHTSKSKPGRDSTDCDSEEDDRPIKQPRRPKGTNKKNKPKLTSTHSEEDSRRFSAASSTSSLDKPATVKVYRAGCKPQKPKDKWWLRINNSTQGETTRTAKIEEWNNEYKFKPLPIGNWATGKFQFQYAHNFESEQLQDTPISARKVHEYITKYPKDGKKGLVLWIQRTPADSGRRYGSKGHSECLFKNCPKRVVGGQDGTIDVGHYRVAFDEKFTFYGKKTDPYDCPAYAHLYCMERFLDFEYICEVADVRADVRSDMPLEPNGKAAFSFLGKPQLPVLKKFVKAAAVGKLRDTTEFREYPRHEEYAPGSRKLHDHTLVYHMSTASWDTKTRSLKKQFLQRTLTPNQQGVNRGDLEMAMVDKKVRKRGKGKKRKSAGKEASLMELYEECDPEITRRMSLLKRELADILAEEAAEDADETAGNGRKRPKQKKRKPTEDDEEDYAYADGDGSPGKRQRTRHPLDDQQLRVLDTHSGSVLSLSPPCHDDQCCPPANLSLLDPQLDWLPTGPTPVFPELSIDDFPKPETQVPSLSDPEVQKLFALQRRQSNAGLAPSGGIMKSPSHGTKEPKHAGFERQPVSGQKEYRVDDPPRVVSGATGERRSARIAAKQGGS
ncbi:hypothetical protein P153DRAFT_390264 [Dothidotthia symphoricarpi CBS 119687]|uniref:Uncharacterized protein n=1 Tax=Dothidotthia symphoricarpi CBS 119687 TaxID=1392245 RepID=A0A6A6A0N3_9PLEO|nr:uncharacterized protein P153DRAFT_390264 [Dothidotthia symphoricarpi CBS 119687]KAF2124795.1 hypothetical protein P153DRAFT_390264 [Dothidotthia symphoricarpi CBS 119687]